MKPDLRSTVSRAKMMFGVSLGALLIAQPALAQDTPQQIPTVEDDLPTDEEGQVVPEGAQPETDDGAIVVTGTRIRQPEFTSADPVSRIDPETAQREGKQDTASMLQSSPIAAGSTQITSAISSNFVTAGGPGAETLDLRGLGPNRTLVLLNSRRAGPAGTRGSVSSFDLNVLPQSIVSAVDILKTGASSIYGSDAIAGVANLFTKKDMDGFQIDANSSFPFDSGGEQYRISGLWGKTFSRGHVMVAGDYFKGEELARGDRSYLDCPEAYTFRPDGSRADLIDPRTGEFKCEDFRWGHVWVYDVARIARLPEQFWNLRLEDGRYIGPVVLMQFRYPGENFPAMPAIGSFGAQPFVSPPGWFPTAHDTASLAVQNAIHPYVLEQTIIPETDRKTLYADASYKITDNIEAFGEFLFNRRETYQNGWRQFWNFGYTGDYFGFGDPAAEGWEGWNWISATGITNQSDTSQDVRYTRGVAGLRGDFGSMLKGWRWDVHAQYSRSNGKYRTQQILQDVYDAFYFTTTSCVGTVLPVSGKQCIDLPWYDPFFLRGEMTQEQIDFMFDWEEGKTIYTQKSVEGFVSGSLFELPAGPLNIAFGATARRDRINDVPGEITRAGNAWGASTSGITAGHSTTTEAFGEVQIPLLRDQPFFRDLSFSAAARLTNVTSVRASDGETDRDKNNWTYKLGANWALNDWVRFRGTYGTSFRAPALFEQFLAAETSFVAQRNIDPCVNWALNLAQGNISQRIADNCAADGVPPDHSGGGIFAEVVASGGIGILDPETSKAKTVSIIFTPRFEFLPRTNISIAADWIDIQVSGEITRLGGASILFGCYSSENFPNDPLCSLFERGQVLAAPFNVSFVRDSFVNIASQRNQSVDVTSSIRHDLGRWGNFNFLGIMTWRLKDEFTLLPGSPVDKRTGEVGFPRWVGDFNFTWRAPGGWTMFYGLDVIGQAGKKDEQDFRDQNDGDLCVDSVLRGPYCVRMRVPATFYHAASVTKEIARDFEMTLGVANLFDTRPPRVTNQFLNAGTVPMLGPVVATSQYDFYGRRVFVNVRRRF